MALAENGPLGPVKGKVKNLVYSSNLGTPYVRFNPGTRSKKSKKEENNPQWLQRHLDFYQSFKSIFYN